MKITEEDLRKITEAPIFNNLIAEIAAQIDWAALPDPGYAIPMIIECAKEYSNLIVDHMPRNSSADHITTYKILSHLLTGLISNKGIKDFMPYFQRAVHTDNKIKDIFVAYFDGYSQLNTVISLKEKIWDLEFEGDDVFLTINPQSRRNATHLLDNKANYLFSPEKVRKLLKKREKADLVELSLAAGALELDILTIGVKDSWEELSVKLGFNTRDFTHFKGFISYLHQLGGMWFEGGELHEAFKKYARTYHIAPMPDTKFEIMLDFFSITPEQADSWTSPCPFFKLNDFFVFWPFCFHVMHPDLLFINLIHRKYSNDWNNTLGANMAKIATYLAAKINPVQGMQISAEKKKGNLGDIDIAVYDLKNDHLLLCEVKSVFDKFRTNYQSTNYIDQKVNVTKASRQLNNIEGSILSGRWRITEIFTGVPNKIPQKISKMILTWWDLVPVDDTRQQDILTMNFKSFLYLINLAEGDLDAFADAVRRLKSIYCPYMLGATSFYDGKDSIKVYRQVQTDILPPKNETDSACSNAVFDKAAHDLPRFAVNWKDQLKGTDVEYHFY